MADSQLISEIRKRPLLYDPKNVDFKDVPKREEAWMEISQILTYTSKSLFTVDDVQNRWKVLRDRYVREKRGRSNGEALPSRKEPWPFVDTLKFLDKYVIHRKSMVPFTAQHIKSVSETVRRWSSSFNLRPQPPLSEKGKALSMAEEEEEQPSALVEACIVEESDNVASPTNSVATTESSDGPTAKPKESKKTKDSEQSAPKDAPNDALVHFSKDVNHNKHKKTDEEELFCLSIAPALRRLPHQKKAFAKLKIMELLYNYEFCDEPF